MTLDDGNQFGIIQGYGAIWQDVNFTEAGTYTLTFQAAHRDYHTGNNYSNPILVRVDGIDIATVTPTSTDFDEWFLKFTSSNTLV